MTKDEAKRKKVRSEGSILGTLFGASRDYMETKKILQPSVFQQVGAQHHRGKRRCCEGCWKERHMVIRSKENWRAMSLLAWAHV